jgi:hypothetical protein
VERKVLLEALAGPLPPGTIRYKSRVTSLKKSETTVGVTDIHLQDGSIYSAQVGQILPHHFNSLLITTIGSIEFLPPEDDWYFSQEVIMYSDIYYIWHILVTLAQINAQNFGKILGSIQIFWVFSFHLYILRCSNCLYDVL